MKQQTAVEWLREQFHKVPQSQFGNLFEQAKQMERKQIEKAYDGGGIWNPFLTGRDYYNQTYGKDIEK